MMKYKEQCGLLLQQQTLLKSRTFFTLLVGIALVLSGIILDMRSAYALNPGDIVIIGVRADDIDTTTGNGNDDAFTWVPLVSLAAGAEIFFTDAGWTASNTFRAQEGAIRYTAPAAGLAAGTVMLLELTRDGTGDYIFTPTGGGGTYSNANDAIVGTTGFLTATSGDQIFIFEGSTAAPNFIWGWKNEGPFDADAISNDTSALPPGLTVGVNAVAVGNSASTDNNRYVGTSNGTASELVAAIANSANWETTESLPFSDSSTDITNGTSGSGFAVGSLNAAPTITSGNSASVAENQTSAIDIQAIDDTDSEGSGLTFSKTGGADQALFNLDTGTGVITFISAPDFETPGDAGADNSYDIQVTVTDSGSLSTVQNIVITVTDVAENTAPTITSGNTASVAENQTGAIDVQATDDADSEGSGLTFSKTGGADQALFNLDTGTGVITFISAPDFETPGDAGVDNSYDIQVTVTDSGGLTALQNIVITVTDVVENTTPVLDSIGNQQVDEGELLAFTVTASDSDGDNLSYAVGNMPTGATFIDNGDGTATFSWIPGFGQAGNFPNVLFTVTDDGAPFASDSETITITVGDVNRLPVLNPIGDRMVAEGDLLEFILTAVDPDGDNLSYAIGNAPAGATLVDNGDGTATFSWTPDFAQAGNFPNVLFTVTDDGTPSTLDQETITITVGDINRPPVLNQIGDRTVAEDELLEFTLTATDPDGDNLSYAIGNAPAGAILVDNGDGTATFSWTPDFAQAGNFPNVLFTVTDDGTPSTLDQETITITVGDINRPPVLNQIGDRTVAEDELLEFTLTATDPDGDNLSYAIGNAPAGATLVDNGDGTAIFNWIPDFVQAGNFPNVLFTVTDDGAPFASGSETITITVGDVNRLPVLSQTGDRTVTEGELLEFILTATDPDGDNLSYVIENMPTGATFADNGDGTATFSWIPGFGQVGNFPSVRFTVTDDAALSASDSETITITVERENSVKIGTGGVGAMGSWWLLILAAMWGLLKISASSLRQREKTLRQDQPRRGFYNKENLSVFSQKRVSK